MNALPLTLNSLLQTVHAKRANSPLGQAFLIVNRQIFVFIFCIMAIVQNTQISMEICDLNSHEMS